jgi:hypothetical protein
MDRYILNVARWMWRNRIASTIGISCLLVWIAPNLFQQIVGFAFDTILETVGLLLSIVFGEASRHSATIGSLIGIGVCAWAIWHMITAPFRKKPKK